MTERPILFSAPMVRALLSGSKTQTRRVCRDRDIGRRCPYGAAGDRLWVREAFRLPHSVDDLPPREIAPNTTAGIHYAAKADDAIGRPLWTGRLRPGMFMPRWASRITLEVVETRVQRLQSISEDDVVAEGIARWPLGFRVEESGAPEHRSRTFDRAQDAYRWLWTSINGASAWELNPLVWAVTFRRVDAA